MRISPVVSRECYYLSVIHHLRFTAFLLPGMCWSLSEDSREEFEGGSFKAECSKGSVLCPVVGICATISLTALNQSLNVPQFFLGTLSHKIWVLYMMYHNSKYIM